MTPWSRTGAARGARDDPERARPLTQLSSAVSNMLNRLGGQPESYDKKYTAP